MEQNPNVFPSWPNTCRLHADTPERLGTHPFDSPELGEALKTIELSAEITGKSSSAHASALASSVTEGLALATVLVDFESVSPWGCFYSTIYHI